MILFQIKVFTRNIKETTLARYFIKVITRPSFTELRAINPLVSNEDFDNKLFNLLIVTAAFPSSSLSIGEDNAT